MSEVTSTMAMDRERLNNHETHATGTYLDIYIIRG